MRRSSLIVAFTGLLICLALWSFTPRADAGKDKGSANKTNDKVVPTGEGKVRARFRKGKDNSNKARRQQESAEANLNVLSLLNAEDEDEGEDADLPSFAQGKGAVVDKENQLLRRAEYIGLRRGVEPGKVFDPGARPRAIRMMEAQIANRAAASKKAGNAPLGPGPVWTPMGPSPIPNGQTQTAVTAVSGRATALVVDPTNSNTVYLGTAQGGVWRSLDGGVTWASIFDAAQTQAIGALALAPSSPTTLYVGTGEANGSCDSYNGIGLYRIDNAPTTATLVGPINPIRNYIDVDGVTPRAVAVFTGRSISQIVVHPTQPGTVFVGTAGAAVSLGCDAPLQGTVPPLGLRGLYRSFNANAATAGAVTFERIKVSVSNACFDTPCTGNRNINDIVMDPNTPNNLVVWQNGINVAGDGGVWRSTNALDPVAANVVFTQTFITTATTTSNAKGAFAYYIQGGIPIIYVASGEPSTGTSCANAAQLGAARVSVDGGVTWGPKLAATGGFCGAQCFYNIGFAVLPGATAAQTDDELHIGGNTQSATCQRLHMRSTDGGATGTNFGTGLHADTHFIVIDPTTPTTIYHGNDGGVYKSIDGGVNWVSRNTGTSGVVADGLNTMQYQGVAVHPTLANYTLGTTQDNGTHLLRQSTGTWVRADSGDGGYSQIDINSTDEDTNIGLYHDFQNGAGMAGYRYVADSTNPAAGLWFSRGCFGNVPANNINCTDTVNFYAPLALGGSIANPVGGFPRQTTYFGTDRLYRSVNQGSTHTIVSSAPITAGVPISAIGVSAQDDNFRVVGLNNGAIYGTTTGASLGAAGTLIDAVGTGTIPDRFVSRAVFNPFTKKQLWITLTGFGVQHVWKTDNFDTGTPTFVAASGSGGGALPDVPVNGLVIDPTNANYIYVGTDIGVYQSTDGGANWAPFGTGLPVVAVFDMGIQPSSRILRIGTHGRGIWQAVLAPTAAPAAISGTITAADGSPLGGVIVNLSGGRTAQAITDSSGNYRFANLDTGNFYTVTPSLTNYHFSPESLAFSLLANKADAGFTATRNAVISGNAIDTAGYFVRQHYLDFLGREPDPSGFAFWSDQITSCGSNADCIERRTINVSAAYFLSTEFQMTGGFIAGIYRSTYGRAPLFDEFMPDSRTVGQNVIVGNENWPDTLRQNKEAFVAAWMQRPEFRAVYDGLANDRYVSELISNTGVSFTQSERAALVSSLADGSGTRASVLRQIVEDERFVSAKRNETFVMMQYFGYLRRDPDPDGYRFWLNKLNQFNGNFEQAEMVKAFIVSGEYRARFALR